MIFTKSSIRKRCFNANVLNSKNIIQTTQFDLAEHLNTVLESLYDIVELPACIVPCPSGGIDQIHSMMENPPGSPKGMANSIEKMRCYIQRSSCHRLQSLASFVLGIADWVGDAMTTTGAATPDTPSSSTATTAWYDTLCNGKCVGSV